MDSIKELGKLKKNRERSKTPRVVRSFWALREFSRTGRNTWSAFCAPTAATCETAVIKIGAKHTLEVFTYLPRAEIAILSEEAFMHFAVQRYFDVQRECLFP